MDTDKRIELISKVESDLITLLHRKIENYNNYDIEDIPINELTTMLKVLKEVRTVSTPIEQTKDTNIVVQLPKDWLKASNAS